MELQNKIRDNELSSAIREQEAQVDEYDTFSTLGKQVSDYLNNTKANAQFPVVPPFKSKTYRLEADKMLNNLEKYSARAELLKTKDQAINKSIAGQTAILKQAMTIPGAVDIDEKTGEPTINYEIYNAGKKQLFDASIQKTQAQTGSIVGNLQLSRDKLNALIANNASEAEIAKARLAVDKSFKEARVKLDEEELGFNKEFKTQKLGLEGEKVDILREKANKTVGLKPTKLDLDELEFSEAVLNGIKPLEPYLNQDLYGPTFNVRVKAGEISGAFGTEREANQVYNNLRSGALFKRGGKALTKSEIGVITSNIGNPTDSGFPDRVNTYKLLQARTLKDRIDKLKTQGISNNPQYSGYLADLEKKANEVLGVEEEAAPETVTQPSTVQGGTRIRFDSQGNMIQ
jgi:hypothetical protein